MRPAPHSHVFSAALTTTACRHATPKHGLRGVTNGEILPCGCAGAALFPGFFVGGQTEMVRFAAFYRRA